MSHEEVFSWAQRMCSKARKASGTPCPYRRVNVYTEFTGSTCAESAVESIVNNLPCKQRPEVRFLSMADIKQSCRTVAMASRY